MDVLDRIQECIEENIKEFLAQVARNYFEDEEGHYQKLLKDWRNYNQGKDINTMPKKTSSQSTSVKAAKKKTVVRPKTRAAAVISEEEEEPTGCPFILQSGKNIGRPCGIKKLTENGYCSRHSGKKGNDRKIIRHVVLKKLWHPQTGYVFEENGEEGHWVVGKTTKASEGETCPLSHLTEDDLEKCKQWKFKVNQELYEKNEKEKNEAVVNEEEPATAEPDLCPGTEETDEGHSPPGETRDLSHEEVLEEVRRVLNGEAGSDIEELLEEIKLSDSEED